MQRIPSTYLFILILQIQLIGSISSNRMALLTNG